jgi:hypothetical protein
MPISLLKVVTGLLLTSPLSRAAHTQPLLPIGCKDYGGVDGNPRTPGEEHVACNEARENRNTHVQPTLPIGCED